MQYIKKQETKEGTMEVSGMNEHQEDQEHHPPPYADGLDDFPIPDPNELIRLQNAVDAGVQQIPPKFHQPLRSLLDDHPEITSSQVRVAEIWRAQDAVEAMEAALEVMNSQTEEYHTLYRYWEYEKNMLRHLSSV
jgi:hypothetical protein